jgi:hypothetical protein
MILGHTRIHRRYEANDRRSRLGVGLAALILVACVIDEPVTADHDGSKFWSTCTIVKPELLGSPLSDAETSAYGSVQAQSLSGTDPRDAIALLLPPESCGTQDDAWLLFWSTDLPQEALDKLEKTYGKS